jgi:uncharacterized protein (DUF2141 family)
VRLGKLPPLLILIWAAMAAPGQASAVQADVTCSGGFPRIKVVVSGVHARGLLQVDLYRPSEHDFLRKASRLVRIRTPATNAPQTVCFQIESAGAYAIAAYHDINGDRDLKRHWNMMPAEPFALSNNPKLRIGLPKFEDAAFQAGEGTTIVKLELRK